MSQTIFYKKAEISDAKAIYNVAKEIWNEHYISIISQAQIDYMLNLMYSESKLIEQMQSGCEFTLAYINDKLLGYISIEEKEPGNFFLHKYYIHKDARGTGLGAQMFEKILNEKQDKKTMRLYVNRSNFKSVNFYFKVGFRIEDVVDNHIGNDFYMNDFVMVRKF